MISKLINAGCNIVCVETAEERDKLEQMIYQSHPEYATELSDKFYQKKIGPFKVKEKYTVGDILLQDKGLAIKGWDYIEKQLKALDYLHIRDRKPRALSYGQRNAVQLIMDVENGKKYYLYNYPGSVYNDGIYNTVFWLMLHENFAYVGSIIYLTCLKPEDVVRQLMEAKPEFEPQYHFFSLENGQIVERYDVIEKYHEMKAEQERLLNEEQERIRKEEQDRKDQEEYERRLKERQMAEPSVLTCEFRINNKELLLEPSDRRDNASDFRMLITMLSRNRFDIEKAELWTENGNKYDIRIDADWINFCMAPEADVTLYVKGNHAALAMDFVLSFLKNECGKHDYIMRNQYDRITKRFERKKVIYLHDNKYHVFKYANSRESFEIHKSKVHLEMSSLRENEKYTLLLVDGKPENIVY